MCAPADINDEMKVAAAYAIADLIPENELNADYIIPNPFDERVAKAVAKAVAEAAKKDRSCKNLSLLVMPSERTGSFVKTDCRFLLLRTHPLDMQKRGKYLCKTILDRQICSIIYRSDREMWAVM